MDQKRISYADKKIYSKKIFIYTQVIEPVLDIQGLKSWNSVKYSFRPTLEHILNYLLILFYLINI